uniref:ANK_REP_REGION domain-containing protein n=1 Tax=Parastrongyloides trichosuri TaxID=131310 RepID=A0A0N4ZHS8_PARTI
MEGIVDNLDNMEDVLSLAKTSHAVEQAIEDVNIEYVFSKKEAHYYICEASALADSLPYLWSLKRKKFIGGHNRANYIPFSELINVAKGASKNTLENVTTVSIVLAGDNNRFTNSQKSLLASKFAKFIDKLFDIYVNAFVLNITTDSMCDKSGLVLHTLRKLKTKKIEVIGKLNFYNLIYYSADKNKKSHLFFENFDNLKEIKFTRCRNEQFNIFCHIEEIKKFFIDMSKHVNCKIYISGYGNWDIGDEAELSQFLELACDYNTKVALRPSSTVEVKYFFSNVDESLYDYAHVRCINDIALCINEYVSIANIFSLVKGLPNLETMQVLIHDCAIEKSAKLLDHLNNKEISNRMAQYKKIMENSKVTTFFLTFNCCLCENNKIRKERDIIKDQLAKNILLTLPRFLVNLKIDNIDRIDTAMTLIFANKIPFIQKICLKVNRSMHFQTVATLNHLKHMVLLKHHNINYPEELKTLITFPDGAEPISRRHFKHASAAYIYETLQYVVLFNNIHQWKNHFKLYHLFNLDA